MRALELAAAVANGVKGGMANAMEASVRNPLRTGLTVAGLTTLAATTVFLVGCRQDCNKIPGDVNAMLGHLVREHLQLEYAGISVAASALNGLVAAIAQKSYGIFCKTAIAPAEQTPLVVNGGDQPSAPHSNA